MRGHIGKRAISVVPVQHVSAQAGQVKIRPAIVVVISNSTTHAETRRVEAGTLGYVGKGAVVIVMVERTFGLLSLERHLDCGRVRKVHVRPAVAVIVDDEDASAHRLDNVFLFRRGKMSKSDPCRLRDVDQLWNRAILADPCACAWRGWWWCCAVRLRDDLSCTCQVEQEQEDSGRDSVRLTRHLVRLSNEDS